MRVRVCVCVCVCVCVSVNLILHQTPNVSHKTSAKSLPPEVA